MLFVYFQSLIALHKAHLAVSLADLIFIVTEVFIFICILHFIIPILNFLQGWPLPPLLPGSSPLV